MSFHQAFNIKLKTYHHASITCPPSLLSQQWTEIILLPMFTQRDTGTFGRHQCSLSSFSHQLLVSCCSFSSCAFLLFVSWPQLKRHWNSHISMVLFYISLYRDRDQGCRSGKNGFLLYCILRFISFLLPGWTPWSHKWTKSVRRDRKSVV